MRLHQLRLDHRAPKLSPADWVPLIAPHYAEAPLRTTVCKLLNLYPPFEQLLSVVPPAQADAVQVARIRCGEQGEKLGLHIHCL